MSGERSVAWSVEQCTILSEFYGSEFGVAFYGSIVNCNRLERTVTAFIIFVYYLLSIVSSPSSLYFKTMDQFWPSKNPSCFMPDYLIFCL